MSCAIYTCCNSERWKCLAFIDILNLWFQFFGVERGSKRFKVVEPLQFGKSQFSNDRAWAKTKIEYAALEEDKEGRETVSPSSFPPFMTLEKFHQGLKKSTFCSIQPLRNSCCMCTARTLSLLKVVSEDRVPRLGPDLKGLLSRRKNRHWLYRKTSVFCRVSLPLRNGGSVRFQDLF